VQIGGDIRVILPFYQVVSEYDNRFDLETIMEVRRRLKLSVCQIVGFSWTADERMEPFCDGG